MECYKKMYYLLFNKMTDVIKDLQAIQAEAEELFILQEAQEEGIQMTDGEECID